MPGKTYGEHLANLKATRDAKKTELDTLARKSMEEERSMDTAESQQFDAIKAEIAQIDKDIARFTELEAISASTAEPPTVIADAGAQRQVQPGVQTRFLHKKEVLKPGIAMARYAIALVAAKGNADAAHRLALKYYPQTTDIHTVLRAQADGYRFGEMIQVKAAVNAGNTTDSTWAAPLAAVNTFSGDFIEYLRPRSLIGQAQFRPVPFNVRINGQTSGGTGYWVGQGKPKPVTKFDFNATTVPFSKVAAIAVITEELARFGDPNAEALVLDQLAEASIARIDSDLFDPDVAAVANVSPAGLLNGVTPVAGPPASGVDVEEIRCAILRLWQAWDSTNLGQRPAYYTTPSVARFLASKREALGNRAFPNISNTGGDIDGVPVRVSNYLANNGGSGGQPFILVDEAEIYLADDGSVTLDSSREASLQMDDAPTNASSPVAATTLVSMWQSNSIALRAERYIWWGPRRSGAVQWIDGFPFAC